MSAKATCPDGEIWRPAAAAYGESTVETWGRRATAANSRSARRRTAGSVTEPVLTANTS